MSLKVSAKRMVNHILYVDDDPDDIDLFSAVKEENFPDVRLTTLTRSEALLPALATVPIPDVIVLDVNMPVLNGLECLQLLKQQTAYKHIPVVIYSTSRFNNHVQEALEKGACNFYQKGHSLQELKQFITYLVSRQLK